MGEELQTDVQPQVEQAEPQAEQQGEQQAEQHGAAIAQADFVDKDGNFVENWRNHLPEELRSAKALESYKNIKDMANSVVHQQRMLGLDKSKLVEIPKEDATPEQKEAFYNAIGRPESPDKYDFKKSPDIPEAVWDDNLIQTAKERLYKAGATQEVMNAISEIENQRVMDAYAVRDQMISQSTEQLKKEWGNNYEQNIHLGNLAIERIAGGDKDLKQRIVDKFGSDADFARFAANAGKNFSEHSAVKPNAAAVPKEQINDKINEIMMSKEYMDRSHPGHKSVVSKLQDLYKQKNQG